MYLHCSSNNSRKPAAIVFYALCLLYVLSTAIIVSDLVIVSDLFIVIFGVSNNPSICKNIIFYQLCSHGGMPVLVHG